MTIERDGLIERELFDRSDCGTVKLYCWLPGSNPGLISIDIGYIYDRTSVSMSGQQARELAANLIDLAEEIEKNGG